MGAFFGSFSGGGNSENEDSIYFATTARYFDVKIARSANGVKIDWTSVIHKGDNPQKTKHPQTAKFQNAVPNRQCQGISLQFEQ